MSKDIILSRKNLFELFIIVSGKLLCIHYKKDACFFNFYKFVINIVIFYIYKIIIINKIK